MWTREISNPAGVLAGAGAGFFVGDGVAALVAVGEGDGVGAGEGESETLGDGDETDGEGFASCFLLEHDASNSTVALTMAAVRMSVVRRVITSVLPNR